MTGRKSFRELKASLGQERGKKIDQRTDRLVAEMLLPEMRKLSGLTQAELARVLGLTQPSLSKIENQQDIRVSTLSRLVEAMGGKLEIIAHLPNGDCRLTQFEHSPSP